MGVSQMPESESNEQELFHEGDWVRCDGQIMYLCYYYADEGQLRLHTKDMPLVYESGCNTPFPETVLYPVDAAQKLPDVEACKDVVRSLFRLETTPWELCEQELYPFSENSEKFMPTEDDLKTFAANLPNYNALVIQEWINNFAYAESYICCPEEKTDSLSLEMTMCMIWTAFYTGCNEPDNKVRLITEIIDVYLSSKEKPLSEIDIPVFFQTALLDMIEENSADNEATEEQRKAYVRFLNKLCDSGDEEALYRKACAYRDGNGVVSCDLKIAEQALLKLDEIWKGSWIKLSLGNIYSGGCLGSPDYDKALYYYRKALETFSIEAAYEISGLYHKGIGAKKNFETVFRKIKDACDSTIVVIHKLRDFNCEYANAALHMGYCYEDGAGCEQNLHKAHEYYQRAKFVLDMCTINHERLGKNYDYNDKSVSRLRLEIIAALECIRKKDPRDRVEIDDFPWYSILASSDLSLKEKAALVDKLESELAGEMEYLYSCEYASREFDPKGHEEHKKRALKVVEKYSPTDFFTASFKWMWDNCGKSYDYCKTVKAFFNIANLFYYYGGTDCCRCDPYHFLACLYNGLGLDDYVCDDEDAATAEAASVIFRRIAAAMLRNAGLYDGDEDEYDPSKDEVFQRHIDVY